MKIVLLFKKNQWNKEEINNFLRNKTIKAKLRYGFSHILAICDEYNINITALKNEKKIICIRFDKENSTVSKEAFLINKNQIEPKNSEILFKEEENLTFDLSNFGFLPTSGVSIEKLFQSIKNFKAIGNADILEYPKGIERIIMSATIPDDMKKILLDTYTLSLTSILIVTTFQKEDILTQYSNIFLLAFVTRAKIEKLMLIIAKLDDALNFDKLDGCKKIKGTFIKQSKESQFELTKMMVDLIQNVELLDDNYRTPEIHKTGRLLALIYSNNFGSLVNEVWSFKNKSSNIFQEICKYLENKYC